MIYLIHYTAQALSRSDHIGRVPNVLGRCYSCHRSFMLLFRASFPALSYDQHYGVWLTLLKRHTAIAFSFQPMREGRHMFKKSLTTIYRIMLSWAPTTTAS